MLDLICFIIIDPSRPLQNTYLGSDDYLRARFEEYILSLLSSVKHAQAHNILDNSYDNADSSSSNTTEEIMTDENEGIYIYSSTLLWLVIFIEYIYIYI